MALCTSGVGTTSMSLQVDALGKGWYSDRSVDGSEPIKEKRLTVENGGAIFERKELRPISHEMNHEC